MRYSLLLVRTVLNTKNNNCTLHHSSASELDFFIVSFCCLSFVYVQTLIDAHLDYVFFDVIQIITLWHKTKSSYYIFSILCAYYAYFLHTVHNSKMIVPGVPLRNNWLSIANHRQQTLTHLYSLLKKQSINQMVSLGTFCQLFSQMVRINVQLLMYKYFNDHQLNKD